MNKAEAKDMLSSLIECQHCLDRALLVAESISIEDEKEALKTALASVIGDILTDAIMPIISQHPDLNPYKA